MAFYHTPSLWHLMMVLGMVMLHGDSLFQMLMVILFAAGHAYAGSRNAEESELRALYHVLSYASHARFDDI